MYLGIDPGISGALALIDDNMTVVELIDWPGDEIAAARIVRTLTGCYDIKRAAIERVSSMGMKGRPCPVCKRRPQQGIASTFKFGTNYGVWKGILAAFGIPFSEVAPKTWQKGVIAKAQDKKPSLAAAGRLFPKAEIYGPRGGGKDGRADALLIADWCRRQ